MVQKRLIELVGDDLLQFQDTYAKICEVLTDENKLLSKWGNMFLGKNEIFYANF